MTVLETNAADQMSPVSLIERLQQAGTLVHFARGHTICSAGERPRFVHVVASGFVAAMKSTIDGLSQNVALHFPGDIVEYDVVSLGAANCDRVALAASAAFQIAASTVRDIIASDSNHAAVYQSHLARQLEVTQEWLLNVGQRSAYARTTYFICEFVYRCSKRLPAGSMTFPLPLTQTQIANTLGLSVVHVNRTLARLREEGLIELRRGRIEILQWPRLEAAAGFHASDLHGDA